MGISVNMAMVYSYYEAGRMIIDEEQNGSERAAYGKYILQELSRRLTEEFGRGFSLSWSHYLILMRINNVEERHFYEIELYM